jgi:hypothetical protein
MTDPNEPANAVTHATGTFKGLSKREYFASMVIQGLLANKNPNYIDANQVVFETIRITDALINGLNLEI